MGKGATRTRYVQKDEHGSVYEVIVEPADWWRRQWQRLLWTLEDIVLFAEVGGAILVVLLIVGLVIALAVQGPVPGSSDGTGPSATFSSWPLDIPPTTPPTAPMPQRY